VIGAIAALWGAARKAGASGPALSLVGLLTLALLGLAWCWGYSVGHANVAVRESLAIATDRASTAMDQTQAVAQAHDDFVERQRAGEAVAMDLRSQLATRDRRINQLQRSLSHVPAIVPTEACPRPDDVRLSVGAVRLYDAALAASGPGGAGDELPGGACGAVGDASGSGAAAAGGGCEQPSTVTLGQFQDVAQQNAALLGECMARLSRLVEFVSQGR
jgi:hypothetical protein